MTERAEDRPGLEPPKLPSLAYMVAVWVELMIVVAFVYEHSWVGLVLCAVYARYTASWQLVANLLKGEP